MGEPHFEKHLALLISKSCQSLDHGFWPNLSLSFPVFSASPLGHVKAGVCSSRPFIFFSFGNSWFFATSHICCGFMLNRWSRYSYLGEMELSMFQQMLLGFRYLCTLKIFLIFGPCPLRAGRTSPHRVSTKPCPEHITPFRGLSPIPCAPRPAHVTHVTSSRFLYSTTFLLPPVSEDTILSVER